MDDQSPKQGDTELTAPHGNTANEKNDKIETAAEKVIATLTKIHRAQRKAESAEHERNNRREKRRFIVEIVEIVLIAVYATVTVFEWRTFDSERKTMEQEFKSSQTNSVQQLSALQRQLEEMKQSRIQEERAWVFVNIPDNALTFSAPSVIVKAIMKNVGKTPALITSEYGNFTENPGDIQRHDPIGSKDSLMLIPNKEAMLKLTMSANIAARILNNVTIYAYGTVYYSDISGNSHWSQFCIALSEKGTIMTSQNFHGSCDDLETAQK